jgi:hypothetical protein
VAGVAFAVAFAGAFVLLNLRSAEPAEPRTRPVVPTLEKPRTQEPKEDPGVLEDMFHPADAREPLTPGARIAKRSECPWRRRHDS